MKNKKQYKHSTALDDETKIPQLQQLSLLKCQIFHIVCSIDKIVDYYNLLAFSVNT